MATAKYCNKCQTTNHDGNDCILSDSVSIIDEKHFMDFERDNCCPKHPDRQIEFHCKRCKELICNLCNGTSHKDHEAETVADALRSVVPAANTSEEKLQKIVATRSKALDSLNTSRINVTIEYKALELEIDKAYRDFVTKAEDDRIQLRVKLDEHKALQMKDIEEKIDSITCQKLEEETKLQIYEGALQSSNEAKSYYDLTTLNTYVESIDRDTIANNQLYKPVRAHFNLSALSKLNLLGSVQESHPSRFLNKSFEKLKYTEIKKFTTPFKGGDITYVNGELWFSEYNRNTIHVYSTTGTKINAIEIPTVRVCKRMTTFKTGVFVATSGGIFLVTFKGDKITKLLDGRFCDISVLQNYAYALSNKGVRILKWHKETDTFTHEGDIDLEHYSYSIWNSIQVTSTNVYIAEHDTSCVKKFTYGGTELTQYALKKKDIRLFGFDSSLKLLMTDSVHILLMPEDGKYIVDADYANGYGLLRSMPLDVAYTDTEMFVRYGIFENKCIVFRFK